MKRRLNLLAAWLFMLGVVAIPAAHKLELVGAERHETASCGCGHSHGDSEEHDSGRGHDAGHCPICQLALIPCEMSVPLILPIVACAFEEARRLPVNVSVASPAHLFPYSCGPPA